MCPADSRESQAGDQERVEGVSVSVCVSMSVYVFVVLVCV